MKGRLSVPTSLEAIAVGSAEVSVSEEPGAIIPHAGICAGGGRATALPTATALRNYRLLSRNDVNGTLYCSIKKIITNRVKSFIGMTKVWKINIMEIL